MSNNGKTWILKNPSKKLFSNLASFEDLFLKETNLDSTQVDFNEQPYPKM